LFYPDSKNLEESKLSFTCVSGGVSKSEWGDVNYIYLSL